MAETRDALKILARITGKDETLRSGIRQASVNFEIAQLIYDARTQAGLSQAALAALIGSKQPVIARLEAADYEGHSLTMLIRIASALGQRLEVRFVPQPAARLRQQRPAVRPKSAPPRKAVHIQKNSSHPA
jgi:transcriptional regulator with XRE-family HTH domain